MYCRSRLQPILLSRFLLNLREASATMESISPTPSTHVRFHLPTFLRSSFSLGNIGEDLACDQAEDDDVEIDAEDSKHGPIELQADTEPPFESQVRLRL